MSSLQAHITSCSESCLQTNATSRRRTQPGNKVQDVSLRAHAVLSKLEHNQFYLAQLNCVDQRGKDQRQRHATWSIPEIDTAVHFQSLTASNPITSVHTSGVSSTQNQFYLAQLNCVHQRGKDQRQRHATWSLPEIDTAVHFQSLTASNPITSVHTSGVSSTQNQFYLAQLNCVDQRGKDQRQRRATWSLPEIDTAVHFQSLTASNPITSVHASCVSSTQVFSCQYGQVSDRTVCV